MATNIKIDFSKKTGKRVMPLHGVNQGPMTKVFTYDARPLFVEAGLPFVRLHDTEYPYGSGEFVDIPCIFKNFDADENDPANYNFGSTDEYIRHSLSVGSKIIYRLGISIEHSPVKRYGHPPKDYLKWARICEHVIRHYNEGWADGYFWNIEYWEIWAEADIDYCSNNIRFWSGSVEDFADFYAVSARHLKSCFPELKIGGPAFAKPCGEYIEKFFECISKKTPRVPLDFYSWHRYTFDAEKIIEGAKQARDILCRYGYGDVPSVLDEWNYLKGGDRHIRAESYRVMKDERGAAFNAAVLCALQEKTDVELGVYFEADVVKEFCGIFDVDEMTNGGLGKGLDFLATLKPIKGFYAFKYFNSLYRLGNQVELTSDSEEIYATAAAGEDGVGLMAVNRTADTQNVTFDLTGVSGEITIRITDRTRTNEVVGKINVGCSAKLTLSLPQNSFVYIGTDLPDPVPTY